MSEDRKCVQLTGRLVRVSYFKGSSMGWVYIKNGDDVFRVICDHRSLESIIQNEVKGNTISLNTFDDSFVKVKNNIVKMYEININKGNEIQKS